MTRPDLWRRLRHWAEPGAAILTVIFALWLATWGGWFFAALGLTFALAAGAWLLTALRRLSFHRKADGPGLVEIDEGSIRYYGARLLGGEIALRDLSEIRMLTVQGRPHWRLKSLDAQALLIPLNATGAAALADAFEALPGIRMGEISAAASQPRAGSRTLWVRPGG